MFEEINARNAARLTRALSLAAIAVIAPLARPADAAPVSCAIPQPCVLFKNSVGSAVEAVTSGKDGKHAAVIGTDLSTDGGTNVGVLGIVGNGGWGLEGRSGNGASGGGVFGTATTATGVYGYSTEATGVRAQSSFGAGLYATSGLGSAIVASSNDTSISAESYSGFGVSATTSSTSATQHAAVLGTDMSTNGTLNDGVFGITGNGGWGVQGQSASGAQGGVVGTATTGLGLYGISDSNDGVLGISGESDAVYGDSLTGNGIHGVSADLDYGAFGVLGAGSYGVVGQSPYDPFMGQSGPNGNITFLVDASGDISYAGMLMNQTYARRGMVTTSYTTRSTAPNAEDVGTGNLAAGTATIRFDPAFKAAIEPHATYQVFLTPGGDTKGLFVTAKSPNGFLVRESQGGHDSVTFDYRIVAPALGHASERMQLVAGTALGQPRARKRPMSKFVLPKVVRMQLPLAKR